MSTDLRVCFVGESFVAGVGDPGHLGWIGRLAAWTEDTGRTVTAYPLGVRRETSTELLERAVRECRPRLPAACDARVVVSTGVNDTTWDDDGARVAPATSVANLRALLRATADHGWPTLVVGPPPVVDEAQNTRIRDLDAAFALVCTDAGVPYVGVVDALADDEVWCREVAAGDGSHPGAAGYRRQAELVWPAWHDWLQR